MLKLDPFQKIGAEFLASKTAALLADEMGLGKTIQAIAACNILRPKNVLIVCPASLKFNWCDEWDRWCENTRAFVHVISGRKATLPTPSRLGMFGRVTIINYDLIAHKAIFDQLVAQRYEIGIFDEAHYLKGCDSARTKAALYKFGIASVCKRKWFLTGTPVLNRPIELFPMLAACSKETLHPYISYKSFAKKFCGGYWDGLQFQGRGATNVDELGVRLRKSFMLRRTKAEVLPELPDKRYQIIPMASPSAHIEELVAHEFTFSKDDAERTDQPVSGSELAILRHEIALAKVPTAIELIKDILQQTRKCVVFAYHRDVLLALKEGLNKYQPSLTMGGIRNSTRQHNVHRFQNDMDARLFIGQITASGVGITLHAADTVVFVESSYVPGEIDQAVDRLHRRGQKRSVLAKFLVHRRSVEENMLRNMIDKRITIKRIMNDG